MGGGRGKEGEEGRKGKDKVGEHGKTEGGVESIDCEPHIRGDSTTGTLTQRVQPNPVCTASHPRGRSRKKSRRFMFLSMQKGLETVVKQMSEYLVSSPYRTEGILGGNRD
jgi:hypothetical protein